MGGTQAILLAAGLSSRMGKPKALLPWFGKTLMQAQVDSLLNAGAQRVVAVIGAKADLITDAITQTPTLALVRNQQYQHGKTTSIKAGIAALPQDLDTILLLAVDQPRPAWVIKRILESHNASNAPVTSPRYQGHGGHPLALSARIRPELETISEERQGIREIMARHESEINRVLFDSPIVRLDINTPEQYESALQTYPTLSTSPAH